MAKAKAQPKETEPETRFERLLMKCSKAGTVDNRDLLEALCMVGITLEECRDHLAALAE